MNSVGLRPRPGVSPETPSQNRGNVAILFLALAPKIGVSFLPFLPLLFISLRPRAWVLEGLCSPHRRHSPPPSCSLALKSCCQRRGDGCVPQSFLSLPGTSLLPGFWEGTLFREGEIPPGRHSLKLTKVKCVGKVGDRPGWKQMGLGRGPGKVEGKTSKGGPVCGGQPLLPLDFLGRSGAWLSPHIASVGLRTMSQAPAREILNSNVRVRGRNSLNLARPLCPIP